MCVELKRKERNVEESFDLGNKKEKNGGWSRGEAQTNEKWVENGGKLGLRRYVEGT